MQRLATLLVCLAGLFAGFAQAAETGADNWEQDLVLALDQVSTHSPRLMELMQQKAEQDSRMGEGRFDLVATGFQKGTDLELEGLCAEALANAGFDEVAYRERGFPKEKQVFYFYREDLSKVYELRLLDLASLGVAIPDRSPRRIFSLVKRSRLDLPAPAAPAPVVAGVPGLLVEDL